jgi:hypothetical protein
MITAPKGHLWLCPACGQAWQEKPASGAHCGYVVVLVETKGLVRGPSGRVTEATAAQIPNLYRKAPAGSLTEWKPSAGGGS